MPLENALVCWAMFIVGQSNPKVIESSRKHVTMMEENVGHIMQAMQSGDVDYLNGLFAKYNPTQDDTSPFRVDELPPRY